MANYSFLNVNPSLERVPCTLGSCSCGDIVLLPTEGNDLAIIIDEDCCRERICIASLDDGTIAEVSISTPCRRYTGTLQFDNKLFEDFI